MSPYPYSGISAKAVLSATYAALVLVARFAAGGYLAGRQRPLDWRPGRSKPLGE
jgi:hypothetical protein